MKFIDGVTPILELTRHNLETLLSKLDDPVSHRTLLAPGGRLMVTAVEDDDHYSDRAAGKVLMPSTGEIR